MAWTRARLLAAQRRALVLVRGGTSVEESAKLLGVMPITIRVWTDPKYAKIRAIRMQQTRLKYHKTEGKSQ